MESILHLEAQSHITGMINMSKKYIEKDFPLHWHDFFEIDIILDGEGSQNLNGTDYRLKAGTAYILNPTDFHGLYADRPIKLFNVMFDENILSNEFIVMLLNQKKDIIMDLSEESFKKIAFLTDIMLDEFNGESAFKEKCIEDLMEVLFFTLMREFKPDYNTDKKYDTSIKKAMLYLHMHFRENPSLDIAAGVAGFCANYFSEMFHKQTGCTYTDYLTKLKLEYAVRLLENSDMTSTALCFECGFSSMSNFLRAFKKRFGISPCGYRKKYREKKKKRINN